VTVATAHLDDRSQVRRGRTAVVLAAVAWSTAGLLQRELDVSTPTQLAGRAAFAVLAILVYVAGSERGAVAKAFLAVGRAGLAVAVLLAGASTCFIVALNHATVASVLFMQALAPIAAALLARMVLGEAVGRRTWLAMVVALLGVGLMVGGPGRPGALGLGLSAVMTLAFAGALVITRHRSDISMAPATCLSQVIVFVVALPFADAASASRRDIGLLAVLGVTQIGLGLVFLTIGARLIPAAEVALLTLLEVVLGPLWVWLALGEHPSAATLAGGAIVLAAVIVQTTAPPEPVAAPAGVAPAPVYLPEE
jgi:drug/metabolite transporter (DMT)-like permease